MTNTEQFTLAMVKSAYFPLPQAFAPVRQEIPFVDSDPKFGTKPNRAANLFAVNKSYYNRRLDRQPRIPFKSPNVTNTTPGSLSLRTPMYNTPTSSFIGNRVSRRDFWNVVSPRGDNIIHSAKQYRKTNPNLYKGIFDGQNVDRKIHVNSNPTVSQYVPYGGYFPKKLTWTYPWAGSRGLDKNVDFRADSINVDSQSPLEILGHELFHPDTIGLTPQEMSQAGHSTLRESKGQLKLRDAFAASPIDNHLSRDLIVPTFETKITEKFKTSPKLQNPTTKNVVKFISDAYPLTPSKELVPHEVGPMLGATRMILEQEGVDTTDPEQLRDALNNLDKFRDPAEGEAGHIKRIQEALDRQSSKQKHKIIEDLIKIMPGIADNTSEKPTTNNIA